MAAAKPKPAKMVYVFAADRTEGGGEFAALLGGKGANLAEMVKLGLPVPPGFTITTEVCAAYYANHRRLPAGLKAEVEQALGEIGDATGARFGDSDNPLLVSVRSGSRASMPGMMDTILNLGLNDVTVKGLAAHSGDAAFCLRQLPPLHPDVRRRGDGARPHRIRGHPRQLQEPQRLLFGHRSRRRRVDGDHRRLQGGDRARAGEAVPARYQRAVVGRDQRRLQ